MKIFPRLVCLFILIATCVPNAQAQEPAKPGISVTPSIARIDLAEEAPEVTVYYKNTTALPITLAFRAQDFTALEEGWKLRFLEEKDAANYQYALSSWLTFERQQLALNPGEQGAVKVFINNERLTPGGHYASILAEIQQTDEAGQVMVKGMLSSLLFVRTNTGFEWSEGSISSLYPQRDGFRFPKVFTMQFNNSGNVETVPHGVVAVYDPFGRRVAKGIVNENSLITLPETIRRYDMATPSLKNYLLPGYYNAALEVNFGKPQQSVSTDVRFFSFGSMHNLVFAIVLLIAISSLVIVWKRRRIGKRSL